MDEFGAALRRTSELRSRKRMDAPAASFSQYRYPLANASEFARGHQACSTGSDDDDMVCALFGHAGSFTGVSCDRLHYGARLLHPRTIARLSFSHVYRVGKSAFALLELVHFGEQFEIHGFPPRGASTTLRRML